MNTTLMGQIKSTSRNQKVTGITIQTIYVIYLQHFNADAALPIPTLFTAFGKQ
jgi:hypothetical protein